MTQRPMTDDDLVTALGPLSLRARLDPPARAAADGRPLGSGADVAALVDHVQAGLFAGSDASDVMPVRRREVAASVAFQAVVGQVANPVLLAHSVLGVGLDPSIDDVRWRPDGPAVRYGLHPLRRCPPTPLVEVIASLHSALVEPWARRLSAVVAVAPRILEGNSAAGIWTAVQAVHARTPIATGDLDAAARAVHRAPLGGDVPQYHRDTCCLIHLAGLAPCTECPLNAPATGPGDAAGRCP